MSGSCTAPLDNVTRIAKQISDMCISNQNFTAHISVAFEKCWWGMLIEFWALLVKIYRWVGIKTSNIIKVWCGVFLENSILNFCGRIWGSGVWIIRRVIKGLLAPLDHCVLGPLVLFLVGEFQGSHLWNKPVGNMATFSQRDNKVDTQHNLWNI